VTSPAWVRDKRLVAAALVLVTLLAYAPAVLGGAFHFDDGHSIVDNEGVRTPANIPRFFWMPQLWSGEPGNMMYRPVLLTTFALDYRIWGYAATGWLLTNVVVHALVAVLVFRLATRLGLSDLAALFAGAVFALHPVLSEVQNYVSSRSESVAALVMLGALHAHLSARASSGLRGAVLAATAIALSVLAVLTKETTAGFFLAVAVFEFVAALRGDKRVRGFALTCAYAVGLVAAFALRKKLLGMATADVPLAGAPQGADPRLGGSLSVLDNVLKVQSRVVMLYGQLLLKPIGLNIDHHVERLATWSASAFAALAFHATIAVAAAVAFFRARGTRSRLVFLCVAWFWIFLAPSVAFPLNVVMNEHRLYLPMIAVALLAGAALARTWELLADRLVSARAATCCVALPFACFVALIVQRSREWADDETLWTTAVERAPESARAHMHLGAVWHERANDADDDRDACVRLLDKALAEYAKSDALQPAWSDLQLDIGNARLKRGKVLHDPADREKALAAYESFGRIVGASAPRPRVLQAAALTELGRHDEALAMALKLKSEDASVTTMYDDLIATILRNKGDKKGAAEAMRRVIAIEEPIGRTGGLLQLGWWCFEDGDVDASEKLLSRALDIAKRTHDPKPPLYIARFLNLVGQGGAAPYVAKAKAWSGAVPPVWERWAAGGPTPGVFTGTASAR